MRINYVLFALVILTLVVISSGNGAGNAPQLDAFDFKKVGDSDRDVVIATLSRLSAERTDAQGQIVKELRGGVGGKQSLIAAAYMAGLYRMERVAPDLATMITLHDNHQEIVKGSLPLWDEYPAFEALVKIGNPSVPYLLKNSALSDDQKVRRLSGSALRIILGAGPAKVAVEEAMASPEYSQKEEAKQRLEAAITLIVPPSKGGDGQ